jgi:hypothetical protein
LGFSERNNLFRKEGTGGEAYSDEGCTLFGKLHLDICTSETGLPPGTKLQVNLERAEDSFVLMRESSDTENYKLVISDINLYCPVAQLSQSTFHELNTLFATKNVALHYRKSEIRILSLTRSKQEYFSDNLFRYAHLNTT